jgi:pimeloyl-ACP methyl ester carboxylesterase
MSSVQSQDGTTIAFERSGEGPPVILVDGALCYREVGWSRKLAKRLSERCTVITYDRRGRGESDDVPPHAPEREVEDLAALIEVAGGSAGLYAVSSGGALALEAAARGLEVRKLVLYEIPFSVDDARRQAAASYTKQLEALIAEDRHGDAVKLFLRHVGLPGAVIALMRLLPTWSKLTAIAHTLAYDDASINAIEALIQAASERWAAMTTPTLALVGGKSPAWMHTGMQTVAAALPNARFHVLEGQTHNVKPKAHAPLLTNFFAGEPEPTSDQPRTAASQPS